MEPTSDTLKYINIHIVLYVDILYITKLLSVKFRLILIPIDIHFNRCNLLQNNSLYSDAKIISLCQDYNRIIVKSKRRKIGGLYEFLNFETMSKTIRSALDCYVIRLGLLYSYVWIAM